MSERKVCVCCKQNRKEEFFPMQNGYRRKVCKDCYAGKERNRVECQRNARISKLIRWGMASMIVTGIYSHDFVKGTVRTCFYDSTHGIHAVTIDAMQMCPLTWEFEV
jgi:hypothetical protein